ncbi:hypothetical protein CUJ84_pRLN3000023 (plasmid) [Rhizobium leguminosarum]|uniref:Uncharacterized protein n=1 Tax=Rhizobium leguminosarum TaxID=384 RepID=A0A2K9ZFY0_RHILE|nr:hypothetical protein CUJ84_pRLN3000023 [Rhizobium leguminosarum]
MIARDHHHGGCGISGNTGHEAVELANGRRRWSRAIKDISGNDQDICALFGNGAKDLIKDDVLIAVECDAIELSPKMQVRCVKNAHRHNLYNFYTCNFYMDVRVRVNIGSCS